MIKQSKESLFLLIYLAVFTLALFVQETVIISYSLMLALGIQFFRTELSQHFLIIKRHWKIFLLHLLGWIMVYMLLTTYSNWIVNLLSNFTGIKELPLQYVSVIDTKLTKIFFIGVILAFVQEITFRLVALNLMQRHFNAHFSISLQALLFAFSYLPLVNVTTLIQVIPFFIIGVYFGYLRHKADNIWYPLFVHLITNIIITLSII